MADGIAIYNKDKTTLYMYYKNAKNVTSIEVDRNVKTLGGYAFFLCGNLKNLSIGEQLSNIGYTWTWRSYISKLEKVNIDEKNPYYTVEKNGIYRKNKETLVGIYGIIKEFEIPDGVKTIGAYAFYGQPNIAKLTLPGTITSISAESFNGCIALQEIKIPNSIQKIDTTAFGGCTSLTKMEIDKEKGSISGMPWGCPIGERAVTWLR